MGHSGWVKHIRDRFVSIRRVLRKAVAQIQVPLFSVGEVQTNRHARLPQALCQLGLHIVVSFAGIPFFFELLIG